MQFTSPNSPASIQFGVGLTTAAPGSAHNLLLVVVDVGAARGELASHGAEVSDVFPGARRTRPACCRSRPGARFVQELCDVRGPDGNTWLLQEVARRLPGRVSPADVGALADLLHETADHHGSFEAVAPPHDWWDWYAAYMDARQRGSTPEAASAAAGKYMADVKHIVVDPASTPPYRRLGHGRVPRGGTWAVAS